MNKKKPKEYQELHLNDQVMVRFSESGRKFLRLRLAERIKQTPEMLGFLPCIKEIQGTDNDVFQWTFWQIIEEFGMELGIGQDCPFVILVEKD